MDKKKSAWQKIIAIAIFPGAIISNELCFKSYNYASSRDFVIHLDIIGKPKNGNRLQVLKPHPDANFFDHNFSSLAFAETMNRLIKKHRKVYGGMQ